jgi:hypothetical protein
MRSLPSRTLLAASLAAALGTAPDARAVRIDSDGIGQALIFPYYTARSSGPNPLNTYASIVNHATDTKALRVRFRDGRMGAETLSFNLFLPPNDVWTGAVVPSGTSGTTLVTTDTSCTDPAFGVEFLNGSTGHSIDFRNGAYSGANDDGAGAGLDRTREGFIEVLEMATLVGTSAQAVAHNGAGIAANCATMQGSAAPALGVPTGGISGTFTLINVANGMDFSGNADALSDLGTRPYFRVAGDPYPDLNAVEIDTVSAVTLNGNMYRSTWTRPVDAVTAALMRSQWLGEYVLDSVTASQTDFVITFPTKRFYVTASTMASPFSGNPGWAADCGSPVIPAHGEVIQYTTFNREEVGDIHSVTDFPEEPPGAVDTLCGVANVFSVVQGGSGNLVTGPTAVLGSANRGLSSGDAHTRFDAQDGWIRIVPTRTQRFASGGTSSRINVLSGAASGGSHSFVGLPVVGFSVRTFQNGTLDCGGLSCQGNYGSAFPLKYQRAISP